MAFTRALGPSKTSPLLADFWTCARAPPTAQGFATVKRSFSRILSATGFSEDEMSAIIIMLNGTILSLSDVGQIFAMHVTVLRYWF